MAKDPKSTLAFERPNSPTFKDIRTYFNYYYERKPRINREAAKFYPDDNTEIDQTDDSEQLKSSNVVTTLGDLEKSNSSVDTQTDKTDMLMDTIPPIPDGPRMNQTRESEIGRT